MCAEIMFGMENVTKNLYKGGFFSRVRSIKIIFPSKLGSLQGNITERLIFNSAKSIFLKLVRRCVIGT
jgi:hypothetical protein